MEKCELKIKTDIERIESSLNTLKRMQPKLNIEDKYLRDDFNVTINNAKLFLNHLKEELKVCKG